MNKRKIIGISLLLVGPVIATGLSAVATTPTVNFERYQVILDRKPFGEVSPIETTAPSTAPGESFAKDFELKGIIDTGVKLRVCLLDRTTSKHFYINTGEDRHGITLVSVNYDDEEVVLKKGTETVTMKLRPSQDAPPPAAEAAPPNPFSRLMETQRSGQPGGATRKPFFSDLQRRGSSPFQRMGTNSALRPRGLESFFKPNTNAAAAFVSPFRPVTPAGQEAPSGADPNTQPAPIFQPIQPAPEAPQFQPFQPTSESTPATTPDQQNIQSPFGFQAINPDELQTE